VQVGGIMGGISAERRTESGLQEEYKSECVTAKRLPICDFEDF
jgi:hypothetical protein